LKTVSLKQASSNFFTGKSVLKFLFNEIHVEALGTAYAFKSTARLKKCC